MMEDDNLEEQIHPLVLVYLGDLADLSAKNVKLLRDAVCRHRESLV
jgi:hypothetical protein